MSAGTALRRVTGARRLFTLVELLLVIAIIALLAGISVPALSKVRERARMASCSSNEKQIGVAVNSYTLDSRDTLPLCEGFSSYYGYPDLKSSLAPYLSAKAEVFKCPSDMLRGAGCQFALHGTSYEWNSFVSGMKIDRVKFTISGLDVVGPLLGDADAVHAGERRNYLYSDGSVRDVLELLIGN